MVPGPLGPRAGPGRSGHGVASHHGTHGLEGLGPFGTQQRRDLNRTPSSGLGPDGRLASADRRLARRAEWCSGQRTRSYVIAVFRRHR